MISLEHNFINGKATLFQKINNLFSCIMSVMIFISSRCFWNNIFIRHAANNMLTIFGSYLEKASGVFKMFNYLERHNRSKAYQTTKRRLIALLVENAVVCVMFAGVFNRRLALVDCGDCQPGSLRHEQRAVSDAATEVQNPAAHFGLANLVSGPFVAGRMVLADTSNRRRDLPFTVF